MRLGEIERMDFWPYLPARDLLDFLRVAQTSRMQRALGFMARHLQQVAEHDADHGEADE